MIFDTNTVVNPRAMMIEPLYTSVTNGTVPGARSPYHLAIWAHISRIYLKKTFEIKN